MLTIALDVALAAEPISRQVASPPDFGKDCVVSALGLELIWIPPGTFAMGSEHGDGDTVPVRQVTLSRGFWLGKYEVTQAEYETVTGANPSSPKGARLPVENVSWTDAMAFCQRLTDREKAAGRLRDNYSYSLPTEAQWEYACRAGTTGDFAGPIAEMGWYGSNSRGKLHPVGEKRPNAWGLYDMHGNVWEWCFDRKRDYSGNDVTDPSGPTTGGSNRAFRGGSVAADKSQCRSFRRAGLDPDRQLWHLGFRLCLRQVAEPVK